MTHGLGLVVGHVHEGGVDAGTELDDLGAHLVAELGVQVGKRLVHKEHLGVTDHGAADGHTLTLAAGKSLGLALEVLGDVQDLRHFTNLLVDDVLGLLAELQSEGQIVIHGLVGIQSVVLEYHGDIPVFGGDVVDQLAVDVQLAVRDFLEARHHSERGGLAAAGGTHQNDEFLVLDLQVHIMYCSNFVVVDLFQSLQNDFRHPTVSSFWFLSVCGLQNANEVKMSLLHLLRIIRKLLHTVN